MPQPVDTVYVEILPDVKGFDRRLARELKQKIERGFSGSVTKSGGGGRGGGVTKDLTEQIFGSQQKFQPHIQYVKSYRKVVEELEKNISKVTDNIDKMSQSTSKNIDKMTQRNARSLDAFATNTEKSLNRITQSTDSKFDSLSEKNDKRFTSLTEKISQEYAKIRQETIKSWMDSQAKIREMEEKDIEARLKDLERIKKSEESYYTERTRMALKMQTDIEKFREQEVISRESTERLTETTRTIERNRNLSRAGRVGAVVSAPFRAAGAVGGAVLRGIDRFGSFWDNLTSVMEAARFAAIAFTGILVGRLALAVGATLPLAIGMGVAALGTLQLGFEGTSKARDRFDAEMKALKPTFEEIRNEASRGLFQGFEGEVTSVVKNLKGPVKEGVFEVGQAWQFVAKGVTDYLASAKGAEVVNVIFDTTARLLRQWRPAVDSAIEGLGNLILKSTPFAEKLNEKLVGGVKKFFDELSAMAADGRLEKFFEEAMKDLDAFVEGAKNAAKAVQAIVDALPIDTLQRYAEGQRRMDFNEAYGEADSDAEKRRLAIVEAERQRASGVKPFFMSDKPMFGPGSDVADIRTEWENASKAIIGFNDTLNLSSNKSLMTMSNYFNQLNSMGAETEGLWSNLATVNGQKATEIYTALSFTNKAAADDFRNYWMEKNDTNSTEWAKLLEENQKKLDEMRQKQFSHDVSMTEQQAAANAQRNANQAAASGQTQSIWSGMWSGLKELGRRGWETMITTNNAAIPGFLAAFNNARAQGSGIMSSLWSGLVGAAQAAWNNIKRIWSTSPVSKATWVAPAVAGGGSVGWADMKGYAHGGIFTGPTAALLGEAGDELAFPLTGSQGKRAMDQLVAAMTRNNEFQNMTGNSSGAVGTGPGIRVWDSQPQNTNVSYLVVESGGSAIDDLIVEVISKVVRDRNGDPVQVFSAGKFQGVPV